jgi:hypothetical protein
MIGMIPTKALKVTKASALRHRACLSQFPGPLGPDATRGAAITRHTGLSGEQLSGAIRHLFRCFRRACVDTVQNRFAVLAPRKNGNHGRAFAGRADF